MLRYWLMTMIGGEGDLGPRIGIGAGGGGPGTVTLCIIYGIRYYSVGPSNISTPTTMNYITSSNNV